MNKRTKSFIHIRNVLAEKECELDFLKAKVEKSRPILKTIYDKVKMKEGLYRQHIERNQNVVIEGKQLAKQYKRLYEQGLQFMKKSQLMISLDDNYPSPIKLRKNRENLAKSIYEQYQQRIERGHVEKQSPTRNPQVKNLRKENEELTKQMESQIHKLRMIREKSQKSLKKSSSLFTLKSNAQRKQHQKAEIKESQIKKKFLQKQKEKLIDHR